MAEDYQCPSNENKNNITTICVPVIVVFLGVFL